ncbi:MAG: phospholipase D family protein [Candidatus Korobacteraceae bacterium]
MLRPDERQHLLEMLRPPAGCTLDVAVGTTYSLDLISALMLPLSFAFFDWEHEDGELVADPLALLEALRRYGDRFTIFCQSGQIRVPSKYPPLVTFLEPCIYDVVAPDEDGVFHPKVWALRFIAGDGAIRYRVLCLSRNLTFDRCWDTVVALDGELTDRSNAIAVNHPLGDLIAALPGLARRPLPAKRRQGVEKIADELRRVRFTWPEGFDENQCRFWVAGLDGRTVAPFGARQDKALIVSPFISNSVVDDFLDHTGETHLVSRPECLQELPQETLQRCKSVSYLAPELVEESDDDAPSGKDEVLEGLHAKLFVIDRGWDASIFSGSFNATVPALQHNVEFMVELVGKKSRFGVEQFLRQVKGETNFADLLKAYDVNAPSVPADTTAQKLDGLLQAMKRAIAAGGPRLVVTAADEKDLFDMRLEWEKPPRWPKAAVEMRAWPITQQAERGQALGKSIVFPRLSYGGLTPLIAFSITAKIEEREGNSMFVMNLPLHGAPEDRQDRVVRSLIDNRDQLLRYILFLLACGDEAAASSGDLRRLLKSPGDGSERGSQNPYLLETMLRALHRSPAQLERVESLLDVLRKQQGSSELLSDDFQKIWGPIWDAARQATAK